MFYNTVYDSDNYAQLQTEEAIQRYLEMNRPENEAIQVGTLVLCLHRAAVAAFPL